jgi:hypothetical protein
MYEKLPRLTAGELVPTLSSIIVLTEAVSTVNRTVAAGPERDLGRYTAGGANCVMHFALLVIGVAAGTKIVLLFAGCSAIRAAAGLIGEPFFGEEVLFRCGKHEFGATVAAG